MKPLICTTFALFGSSALLSAATYFTENFNGGTFNSSNMALGTPYGTTSTNFTNNDFHISSGDGGRIYLGTVGTNYIAASFVFQATVTIPSTSAWASPFLGMGSSTADGGNFGEPITGSDLSMVMRSDIGGGDLYSRDNSTNATGAVHDTDMGTVIGGTHLMRMTWNATSGMALFEFDTGNDGSIDGSFSLNGADNGFTGSNSQLFLGGGAGLKFDNISIVPEPSVALLGGLGLLALLRRRR